MSDTPAYTPPKVWVWNKANGGRFANINRPIAGPTHDKELPVGRHPLQLYSLATPNGVKVTVMLEELLALGHAGAEYDAWLIRINEGDQFGSGFVAVNPNSKIPALLDRSGPQPIRVFESGAILLYLAEKFGAFLPTEPAARAECLSWLFWQMGSAPYLGGGFGHFYAYAPTQDRIRHRPLRDGGQAPARRARPPPGRERLPGRRRLHHRRHRRLALVRRAGQGPALRAPASSCRCRTTPTCSAGPTIAQRPAVQRGRMVNRTWGEPAEPAARAPRRQRLRHSARCRRCAPTKACC
jgi:GST-like protein